MYRKLQEFLKLAKEIPKDLRDKKSWLCWKMEDKDGKPTKVPYVWHSPTTKAATTRTNTWGTFRQVLHGWRESIGKANTPFDGVGIVLNDFVGIDLDNSMENGVIKAWAEEIVDELPCYWEISPSRKGLKGCLQADVNAVLAKYPHLTLDTLPKKNPKYEDGVVEIYGPWTPRFFTITGRKFPGSADSLADCQDGFEAVFDLVFEKRLNATQGGNQGGGSTGPLPEDDQVILNEAFASKHGEVIRSLYEGRYDTAKYPSDSEARYGLLGYLVFWVGDNPETLDRIVRSSALYSQKWDRLAKREIGNILAEAKNCYDWSFYERRVVRERQQEQYALKFQSWKP